MRIEVALVLMGVAAIVGAAVALLLAHLLYRGRLEDKAVPAAPTPIAPVSGFAADTADAILPEVVGKV